MPSPAELLPAPKDSQLSLLPTGQARVCLGALCSHFVCMVRVRISRATARHSAASLGGQSLHISLSHMAQSEDVDAFFPCPGEQPSANTSLGAFRSDVENETGLTRPLGGSLMVTLSALTSSYFKVYVLTYCCFIPYRYV